MKSVVRLSVLAIVALLLAGCGFHLRGMDDATPTMSVNYDYSITVRTSVPELRMKLAESLVKREFNLVEQDADYQVEIFDEQYNEDDFELEDYTLGLKIRTLNYSVKFRLMNFGRDEIVAPQTIAISVDYSRIGEQEISRDATTRDALRRSRQQVAELLADRVTALILGN